MLLGHVLSFFPVTFRCLQLWCQGSVSHGECIVISYLGKHPCLANSPDFRPCGLSGLGLVASAAANRFAAKETEEDRAFRIHFACVLCIVPRQRQKPEATKATKRHKKPEDMTCFTQRVVPIPRCFIHPLPGKNYRGFAPLPGS